MCPQVDKRRRAAPGGLAQHGGMNKIDETARLFDAYAALDPEHRRQVVWLAEQLFALADPARPGRVGRAGCRGCR